MLQSFTRNYDDKSTEEGFQFVFKCDVCGDGYQSNFVASATAKKKNFFNKVSRFGGMVSEGMWAAGGALGGQAYRTPAWEKEHEAAFQKASNEALSHFKRCPRCHKYACDLDWNEEAGGLCSDCAPKLASEVGAAKAQVSKEQVWENVRAQPQVQQGDLKVEQTICPSCGKTAGSGKFCNNCGAPLGMKKCPGCGAENNPGVNFCSNCGGKV
ncbi:MAG: zinc ribbon domain-containing protein [Candidatus Thermoplasmatota archaeon]|nr:zinc ribbon domain-containing protein [Candidatus Thermoplasmatota archaeon]